MGKYETEYYIIREYLVYEGPMYAIKWLSSGSISMGYISKDEARRAADRIVQRCLDNPGQDARNL